MSTRIHRWFGVPPELLETGTFAKMSLSAIRLYAYLYWMSDRRSSRQFKTTDADACKLTGASERALTNARQELKRKRLVEFERVPGGEFTYTICDIRTGQPYSGDPRAKVRASDPIPAREFDTDLPKTEDFKPYPFEAESDTDFNFGENVKAPPVLHLQDSASTEINDFSKRRRQGSPIGFEQTLRGEW